MAEVYLKLLPLNASSIHTVVLLTDNMDALFEAAQAMGLLSQRYMWYVLCLCVCVCVCVYAVVPSLTASLKRLTKTYLLPTAYQLLPTT